MLSDVRQRTIEPVITGAVAAGSLVHTDEYVVYARLPAWGYRHKTVCHRRGEYARDEERQHHRGLLVAAALLAAPAPRHLARPAAALPRLLPVRAQRTPPRQSPARRPRCGSRDMTHTTTPKPNKSDPGYAAPAWRSV